MTKKFYKVIKENFMWDLGAVLENSANGEKGYYPIDGIWLKREGSDEYISDYIIEKSPDYFQKVYHVNLISKTVYKIKEEAKEMWAKQYKD